MDNTVKKKLSVFRKRQTVFVIIYGLINVAVIAGISRAKSERYIKRIKSDRSISLAA